MSFDLLLYQRPGLDLSRESVKGFFVGRKYFEVQDLKVEGFQAWYQNPSTGVYFAFDSAKEDAEEAPELPDGFGPTRLSFNINFSRPSFFAFEAMPVVEFVGQELGLLVIDPQEATDDKPTLPQKCDADALIKSWIKHNASAVRALHLSSPGTNYAYLPREKASYWWSFMRSKGQFESDLKEDVFIPDLILLKRPESPQVRTAVLWSDALPQLFPDADYVIQNIIETDGSACSKELRLLPYPDVMNRLSGILRTLRTEATTVAYLPENSTEQIRKIFDNLSGPALKGFEFVGPDEFVDEYIPEKFGSAIQ